MKSALDTYKPAVYAVLSELFACYEELAQNKRVHKAQADMKWNAFSAYTEAGFTREEAMVLLMDADATRKRMLDRLESGVTTMVKAQA